MTILHNEPPINNFRAVSVG